MHVVGRVVGMVVVLLVLATVQGQEKKDKTEKKIKDPTINGRTIAEWRKDLDDKQLLVRIRAVNALMQAGPEARDATASLLKICADKDESLLQPLATLAISRIGPDAVPVLEKACSDASPRVRLSAALLLGIIGPPARAALGALTKNIADPDAAVRAASLETLGNLGSLAKPALAKAKAALGDRELSVQFAAAVALWQIDKRGDGVGVLEKVLGEADSTRKLTALRLLGEMGPKATTAIASVKKLAESVPASAESIAATLALSRLTSGATAIERLVRATKEKDPSVAKSAISALQSFNTTEEGVNALLEILKSPKVAVELRAEAACALCQGDIEKMKAALETALGDGDLAVRWWSALALASSTADVRRREEDLLRVLRSATIPIGDNELGASKVLSVTGSSRVSGIVAEILRTRSSRWQSEAMRFLARSGVDVRAAQAELLSALGSEEKFVRRLAAEAVATMNVEALPLLVKRLGDADGRVRGAAARGLGLLGVQARSSADALKRLLADPEPSVRVQVALALWRIEQDPDVPLGLLNLVIKDIDNRDRWEAMEAIGLIGSETATSIRGLTELQVNGLKDREAAVRVYAARGLYRRLRDAKTALPFLREALNDRESVTKIAAIEVLGEMAEDEKVVALLSANFEDRDVSVRLATMEALARQGQKALPGLLNALESKNAKVQLGAIRTLGLMGESAKKAKAKLKAIENAPLKTAIEETLRMIEP